MAKHINSTNTLGCPFTVIEPITIEVEIIHKIKPPAAKAMRFSDVIKKSMNPVYNTSHIVF